MGDKGEAAEEAQVRGLKEAQVREPRRHERRRQHPGRRHVGKPQLLQIHRLGIEGVEPLDDEAAQPRGLGAPEGLRHRRRERPRVDLALGRRERLHQCQPPAVRRKGPAFVGLLGLHRAPPPPGGELRGGLEEVRRVQHEGGHRARRHALREHFGRAPAPGTDGPADQNHLDGPGDQVVGGAPELGHGHGLHQARHGLTRRRARESGEPHVHRRSAVEPVSRRGLVLGHPVHLARRARLAVLRPVVASFAEDDQHCARLGPVLAVELAHLLGGLHRDPEEGLPAPRGCFGGRRVAGCAVPAVRGGLRLRRGQGGVGDGGQVAAPAEPQPGARGGRGVFSGGSSGGELGARLLGDEGPLLRGHELHARLDARRQADAAHGLQRRGYARGVLARVVAAPPRRLGALGHGRSGGTQAATRRVGSSEAGAGPEELEEAAVGGGVPGEFDGFEPLRPERLPRGLGAEEGQGPEDEGAPLGLPGEDGPDHGAGVLVGELEAAPDETAVHHRPDQPPLLRLGLRFGAAAAQAALAAKGVPLLLLVKEVAEQAPDGDAHGDLARHGARVAVLVHVAEAQGHVNPLLLLLHRGGGGRRWSGGDTPRRSVDARGDARPLRTIGLGMAPLFALLFPLFLVLPLFARAPAPA
mmetsp:Transcript_26541/g.59392  ORF Transcript_26541/g.59392 Transcript_26541/m.59392 type:complete len:640 (+) Transcript_26541:940-2859(+)